MIALTFRDARSRLSLWRDPALRRRSASLRFATPGPVAAGGCLRAERSSDRGGRGAGARHALPRGALQLKTGAGVHHRRAASVNGRDDLLRGDALEVRAGRGEVRVGNNRASPALRSPSESTRRRAFWNVLTLFAESRPDARARIAMALQPAGPFHGWIVSALDRLEPSPNRATADASRPSSHLRSD